MIIYVDIDNTITQTEGTDYENAHPLSDRIRRVNELYNQGHRIVYWTARGTRSGIDFGELTRHQLVRWGARFHELKMGKPVYDLFIDDKNIHSEAYFTNETLES
jgi:dTDP-glucose 4,6-dehydratase